MVAGGQDEAAEILARIRNAGFGATGNPFAEGSQTTCLAATLNGFSETRLARHDAHAELSRGR